MQRDFRPIKTGKSNKPSAGPLARSVSSPWYAEIEEEPKLDDYSVKNGDRAAAFEKIIWVAGHAEPISEACRKGKYTIAIRETGGLSIKRIAQGAKAKPHTILEKSIKASSLKDKYGDGAEAVEQKLGELDLLGFVGHWSATELLGVRIAYDAATVKPWPRIRRYIESEGTGEDKIYYLPINLSRMKGGRALELFKRYVPNWRTLLYTGDYDLHEAYSAKGGTGGGQIVEASKEKVNLLNSLNTAISDSKEEVNRTRTGKAKIEHGRVHVYGAHAMFQHGDQATYQMNQVLEARRSYAKAKLVPVVASESDEPIAWCLRGDWFVTRNRREHRIFRTLLGKPIPSIWTEKGQRRVTEKVENTG